MTKYNVWLVILVIVLVFGMMVTGCGNGGDGEGGNEKPNGEPTIFKKSETVLKAEVISPSGDPKTVKVLSSFSNGINNYYLIHGGIIKNTHVATVFQLHYFGVGTMTASATTVTTNTISTATRNIVSNSFTAGITNTYQLGTNLKSSIEASYFNIKAGIEATVSTGWKWEESISITNEISKETSFEEVETITKEDFSSWTLSDGNPEGWYRSSLLTTCDIYFIVATSIDNQELLNLKSVIGTRNNDFKPYSEYSIDGNFDYTPEDTIELPNEFWRSLPIPPKTSYTETRSIDGDQDITKIGYLNGTKPETFNPDLPIPELKELNYNRLHIDVSFNYRAEDSPWTAGNLRLRLANHNSQELRRTQFGYEKNWTRVNYTFTVSIDATNNDTGQFMLLWSRAEDGGLFTPIYTEFEVGNRTITVTALK